MYERDPFSFKETTKRFFLPFKNKRANLAFYIFFTTLAMGITANDYRLYKRDLTRYEVGEIDKKPKFSEHYTFNQLEKWLSNK